MLTLFRKIFMKRENDNALTHVSVTRKQGLKFLREELGKSLYEIGFIHSKANRFWRVEKFKTDVIEIRFLTPNEKRSKQVPESSFTIIYGFYMHFIPHLQGDGVGTIYNVESLITPLDVYCHFRGEALDKSGNMSFWYVSDDDQQRFQVLSDVVDYLKMHVLPLFDKYCDMCKWVDFIESNQSRIDIGTTESHYRNYIRGFTYKYLGDKERAKLNLLKAKKFVDERNERDKKLFREFPEDAPVFQEQKIIDSAIQELG